jgi:hypothetical protein
MMRNAIDYDSYKSRTSEWSDLYSRQFGIGRTSRLTKIFEERSLWMNSVFSESAWCRGCFSDYLFLDHRIVIWT